MKLVLLCSILTLFSCKHQQTENVDKDSSVRSESGYSEKDIKPPTNIMPQMYSDEFKRFLNAAIKKSIVKDPETSRPAYKYEWVIRDGMTMTAILPKSKKSWSDEATFDESVITTIDNCAACRLGLTINDELKNRGFIARYKVTAIHVNVSPDEYQFFSRFGRDGYSDGAEVFSLVIAAVKTKVPSFKF